MFLSTIPGPVVLVGHSYGGAVITNAAAGSPGVKSLVYVAAYALAEGETIAAANELGGGTALLGRHIQVRPFPGAAPGDVDAYIDPALLPGGLRPGPAPTHDGPSWRPRSGRWPHRRWEPPPVRPPGPACRPGT